MPNPHVERIVAALQETKQFHNSMPVTSRPMNALWAAHERALLALRMPMHYDRLRKAKPKPKAYTEAIDLGLAILAAFARVADSQRAIVTFRDAGAASISFQPRPWGANWTSRHALSSGLVEPKDDPMTADDPDRLPRVTTGDLLHMARKLTLAFLNLHDLRHMPGSATFEFLAEPLGVRMVFNPFGHPEQSVQHFAEL
jgi:hypothetical protein